MDAVKTGALIRKCRTEKNYTQKQLAEMINVSAYAVSKWENGRGMPDISLLEDLAHVLDISISELVMGEENAMTQNISFILFEKDMEMSCDEAVIEHSEKDIRAAYSAVLFEMATVLKYTGGFYTIRFENGGGVNVRESRIYPTRKEAEQAILNRK